MYRLIGVIFFVVITIGVALVVTDLGRAAFASPSMSNGGGNFDYSASNTNNATSNTHNVKLGCFEAGTLVQISTCNAVCYGADNCAHNYGTDTYIRLYNSSNGDELDVNDDASIRPGGDTNASSNECSSLVYSVPSGHNGSNQMCLQARMGCGQNQSCQADVVWRYDFMTNGNIRDVKSAISGLGTTRGYVVYDVDNSLPDSHKWAPFVGSHTGDWHAQGIQRLPFRSGSYNTDNFVLAFSDGDVHGSFNFMDFTEYQINAWDGFPNRNLQSGVNVSTPRMTHIGGSWNHPGGMQMVGNHLIVGVQDTDDWHIGELHVFDMAPSARYRKFSIPDSQMLGAPMNAGATYVRGYGRSYDINANGLEGYPPKHFLGHGMAITQNHEGTMTLWKVRADDHGWLDWGSESAWYTQPNWTVPTHPTSAGTNLNLVTQFDGKVYALVMDSRDDFYFKKDVLELYEVSFDPDDCGSHYWCLVFQQKNSINSGGGLEPGGSFHGAAGIYIYPPNDIWVYSSEWGDNGDSAFRVYEWRANETLERPTVYVDVNNATGVEDGSNANPFNTVAEGITVVSPNGTVLISPGVYPETLVIYRAIELRVNGSGMVIIGQ